MTTVVFRPLAQRDLEKIAAYIAEDNPVRAETFVQELIDLCQSLDEMPRRGKPRDDLAEGLMMLVHDKYLIFYDYDAGLDIVSILRVTRGSRLLPKLKIR